MRQAAARSASQASPSKQWQPAPNRLQLSTGRPLCTISPDTTSARKAGNACMTSARLIRFKTLLAPAMLAVTADGRHRSLRHGRVRSRAAGRSRSGARRVHPRTLHDVAHWRRQPGRPRAPGLRDGDRGLRRHPRPRSLSRSRAGLAVLLGRRTPRRRDRGGRPAGRRSDGHVVLGRRKRSRAGHQRGRPRHGLAIKHRAFPDVRPRRQRRLQPTRRLLPPLE